MNTDTQQAVQEFLETHRKVREIAAELAPIEERYLAVDGLGSAGMEVDGVLDLYKEKSAERSRLVGELERLRTEAGDENILAGLKDMPDSEAAREYIHRVPLREFKEGQEAQKEKRRGFFGRFR